ncbi:MAG: hypothetical protein DRI92_01205, partial [Aquificota bacterium]
MKKTSLGTKGIDHLTLCYRIVKAKEKDEILQALKLIHLEDLGLEGLVLIMEPPWGDKEIFTLPFSNPELLKMAGETERRWRFTIELENTTLGHLIVLPSKSTKANLEKKKAWQIIAKILAASLEKIWKKKELSQKLQAMEKELLETVKELKKNKEIQATLMKRVAHELRTPLHSIIGFSQILKEERSKLPPHTQNCLNHILEKAKEMKETIEDITLLWEMKKEEEKLRIENTKLHPLVEDVLETLSPSILEKDLNLKRDIEVSYALLDRDKIHRALHHLLSNAVKFTPPGGKIGVEVKKTPGGIKIFVWDTGTGIPPEHMEEIWEPFKQLEDPLTRKYQGVGVGLPLVRRI